MKLRQFSALALVIVLIISSLSGCGGASNEGAEDSANTAISVVSREDGSGTRGAFIELFEIEEKQEDGTKIDRTYIEAEITNNTNVMLTSVSANPNSIGYVSLGSLNDSVKALAINGAAATVDNIKNGSYEIARPFNIATKGDVSVAAQDFIDYILSSEGQLIVESKGYISAVDGVAFTGGTTSGKVVVAGSSSVTPVMEALKEAYMAINPNVTIEVQQSDSTTGMTSAIEGICDIGMASRAIKDSELEKGLTPTVIAMDGIAVIVHKNNALSELSKDQVKSIFVGETTDWSQL